MSNSLSNTSQNLKMAMESMEGALEVFGKWLEDKPSSDSSLELMEQIEDLTKRNHLLEVEINNGLNFFRNSGEKPSIDGSLADLIVDNMHHIHDQIVDQSSHERLGSMQPMLEHVFERSLANMVNAKKYFS